MGGVTFIRSKNGNLYRSGLVRVKRHVTYSSVAHPADARSIENNPDTNWTLMTILLGKMMGLNEARNSARALHQPVPISPRSIVFNLVLLKLMLILFRGRH